MEGDPPAQDGTANGDIPDIDIPEIGGALEDSQQQQEEEAKEEVEMVEADGDGEETKDAVDSSKDAVDDDANNNNNDDDQNDNEAEEGGDDNGNGGEVEAMMEIADEDPEDVARKDAESMNVQAFAEELESKYAILEEEHETCKDQLEARAKELRETHDQVKMLNEEKLQLEKQLAEAKRLAQTIGEGNKTTEQERTAQKERIDRLEAEGDSLREEIT